MSEPKNPGIERGMTAVGHHSVHSVMHIGMSWGDAEALFITLSAARTSGQWSPAPSHVDAVNALTDLLAERIYVIRKVVTEPSRREP